MQVFAHFRRVGHSGKGFRAHIFRVRAHKAHTANAIDRTYRFEQLGKHGAHTAHACFTAHVECDIAAI